MSDAPFAPPVHVTPRTVGIGASAGGLDALERFFAQLPLDTACAYVVVQHMGAGHKSLLSQLLQKVTRLPVHPAQEGMVLAPNTVYVMPADGELTVANGCLHFRPATKPLGPHAVHHEIDALLHSLAADQGPQAVGVILSGMGCDGVQGMQAIHRQGGLCLAQQPDTAAYADMPQNAIAAGGVDQVAPPQDLPAALLQCWQAASAKPAVPDTAQDPAAQLQAIVRFMHVQHRHDFSQYKTSTLQRRAERRVKLHHLPSMSAYLQYLQSHPQELDSLFSEMLIGVTAFFRDPDLWLDLAKDVLPPLLAASEKGPLRAWVMGCSTGEEAYSLAMALQEAQDAQAQVEGSVEGPVKGQVQGPVLPRGFQIFATDVNPTAIAVARKAWYSPQAVAGLSAARLARFFTPQRGGYQLEPGLRSQVLFAVHDVSRDPPFTRLDLLTCRNVLIYFNTSLQQRLLPLFHFSLRPGGALVLGNAETVGRSRRLFGQLGAQSHIYRRLEKVPLSGTLDFPIRPKPPASPVAKETAVNLSTPAQVANLQTLAEQILLQTFSPPAVLVNADGDILYVSGHTGRYLEPAAGKANWNVHAMLSPAVRSQVAMALRHALQTQNDVVLHGLAIEGDAHHLLQLHVQALKTPKALAGKAMLVFKEVPLQLPKRGQAAMPQAALQAQLQSARDALEAMRGDMQNDKDNLQALNESLQSGNEALQSSNEELTTSKEEAQSMNEELQTINGELQTRMDDLAMAQSDMQNLLNSTDIATLFLDKHLNVRHYTDKAVGLFHLRESDVGRPLSDLASTLDYASLPADVQATLRSLQPCIKSVTANDGRWFSVRIVPYRTLANLVQGAVLTFVDISAAKALEFRLRDAQVAPSTSGEPK